MRKLGHGFTIVELLVTITILVILTTLVIVRLQSTEAGARDNEREIDITTIANGLEVYYQDGSPDRSIPKGYYPGRTQVQSALSSPSPFNEFLEGVSKTSFEAPGRTITTSFNSHATTGTNPDGSYTDAQARTLLSSYPYLYHPVQRNNAYCASYENCVKFYLYYLEEDTDTVIVLRSKNQ